MATNTLNGKRYIGVSKRGLAARRRTHYYDVRIGNYRCPLFHRAIHKYGNDAFKWEILSEFSSFQEMMDEEIKLIAELSPEYNITKGGGGTLGVSNPLKEEHKKKVVSALVRGQLKIKKKVRLVESGEIFDSIALAARKYHLNEPTLYDCLKFGRSYNGFNFRLLDSYGKNIVVKSAKTKKEILCLTDMTVHESILSASVKYDINRATLTRRCDRGDIDLPVDWKTFCYLDEWCPNSL